MWKDPRKVARYELWWAFVASEFWDVADTEFAVSPVVGYLATSVWIGRRSWRLRTVNSERERDEKG